MHTTGPIDPRWRVGREAALRGCFRFWLWALIARASHHVERDASEEGLIRQDEQKPAYPPRFGQCCGFTGLVCRQSCKALAGWPINESRKKRSLGYLAWTDNPEETLDFFRLLTSESRANQR